VRKIYQTAIRPKILFLANFMGNPIVVLKIPVLVEIINRTEISQHKMTSLKNIAGKAPWTLLHCPNHDTHLAQHSKLDSKNKWQLKLRCGVTNCSMRWSVCILCNNQRSHMTQQTHITRHGKLHVSKQVELPNTISPGRTKSPVPSQPRETNTTYLTREASKMFFKQLSEGKNPIRHLVSNAALRDPGTADALDEEDIKTFMSIAQFIATLSRTQRENFASVTNSICDTHLRQSISKKVSKKDEHDQPSSPKRQKPNTSPVVPVPRTKEELRSIFKEGKTSLFKNLPHPAVYTESNHSYILPSECVADLMAHGIIDVDSTADKLSPVESLACCPLARAITEENNHHGIKTIIVSRWSDDFEPNSGMKGGRGTIWITTLTIQTAKSGTPGISHVYPLAVGPTDSDHEPIERIILDDLKKLDCTRNNPRAPVEMFNGQTKQNEKVSVHFLAMTQDQPERRSSNGMLGGKSTYHARFGYSFKIKDFIDTLPACTECLKHMEQAHGTSER
jgi:hypothetical protein